ncbi:NAD-dependent succinate-semialdehyde dehydrogenase [Candidatus Halocynthiibacter alkanivorans]|uniref:NAD-dependent succinate-semialdehyde dehydrogenase n=1 Tax=Candidatus Halocynthiibacter alkanivorans TaxID=2267619 RepID=UPI000DF298B6|nr:NAD-dependent succinate-semialdehyde dehydrogenase [Candidatus Halocynthiibacter alkanivorans]
MKSLLKDPGLFVERNLIGGAWVPADSDMTIAVENPSTGQVIGTVPDCGWDETQAAMRAAETAFLSWKKTTAGARAAVLERWHDLILAHKEDLATIMTLEQGKPIAESRGEIGYGASFVKWFAEEAKRTYGETIPGPVPDRRIIVQKQPIGVAAAITPWNFPTAMITRKVAPALAAGCTIVVKPSELTPYSALALGVLAERAGIPAGVINIVTGDPQAVGGALTSSPVVRKLSFTGSTRVGKILMQQSAATMKRLSLELGGNAPFLIFEDADLDLALEGVMASKFRNGGQTCVCANRIYVQDGVYDAFAALLVERVAGMCVGDGFADGVEIGPMINEAALGKIQSHLDDAVAKGGSVLTGGARISEGGRLFQPAVISGAHGGMLLAQEETFGPVAPLFRFSTEDEAVTAANDTPFGLAAYLYTNDLSRSFRVGEALETGMVSINVGGFATEVAPFGGVKESGLGREGSHHGIDEFLELKTFHIGGI